MSYGCNQFLEQCIAKQYGLPSSCIQVQYSLPGNYDNKSITRHKMQLDELRLRPGVMSGVQINHRIMLTT